MNSKIEGELGKGNGVRYFFWKSRSDMQKLISTIYTSFVLLNLFTCGCATHDPVPPTIEFYEINSKDFPQQTINIIAEREKGTTDGYKFMPYIKLRDSEGSVWLINISSKDPDSWSVHHINNGQIEEVPFVLSQEYSDLNYGQINKMVYSDFMVKIPEN